jgi:hypothetical protein
LKHICTNFFSFMDGRSQHTVCGRRNFHHGSDTITDLWTIRLVWEEALFVRAKDQIANSKSRNSARGNP